MARLEVNNILNLSIGSTSIGEAYQGLLADLTAAHALGIMLGIGMSVDWSLGEFSVSKASATRSEAQRVQFFADRVNAQLKGISRGVHWYKAYG